MSAEYDYADKEAPLVRLLNLLVEAQPIDPAAPDEPLIQTFITTVYFDGREQMAATLDSGCEQHLRKIARQVEYGRAREGDWRHRQFDGLKQLGCSPAEAQLLVLGKFIELMDGEMMFTMRLVSRLWLRRKTEAKQETAFDADNAWWTAAAWKP